MVWHNPPGALASTSDGEAVQDALARLGAAPLPRGAECALTVYKQARVRAC